MCKICFEEPQMAGAGKVKGNDEITEVGRGQIIQGCRPGEGGSGGLDSILHAK